MNQLIYVDFTDLKSALKITFSYNTSITESLHLLTL